jgi:hypothetical protein
VPAFGEGFGALTAELGLCSGRSRIGGGLHDGGV